MKSNTRLYHALFWAAVYGLWVLIFRSYSFSLTKTMTIEFCYLIFITADYYAIDYFVVPQFLKKRKSAQFAAATLLIIAVSAYLRTLVAVQMNLHFFHTTPVTDFATLMINSVVNISFWVALILMGKALADRMQTQQQLEALEKERIKTELDYLKAQINPHALFNSLNTIYGHIDKSNQVARNILLQFSELLRYQLYDCSAEKVSLCKEIAYIENYIAFQRLRKNEKLTVGCQIEPVESGLTIAPLLLTILLENAFKFVGNFPDKENRITIHIFTKGAVLHTSIVNTKEPPQAGCDQNSGGIGLVNLQRRLQLLYPQKHQLTTNMEKELYETNLTIDLA